VFPANVKLEGKVIASANTLAYLASSTGMKEKYFITLTPCINVVKLLFFQSDSLDKKARVFVSPC
jgi:hypothetical protein